MVAKQLCRTTLLAASFLGFWATLAMGQPPSPNGNAHGWVQGQLAAPRGDWLDQAVVAEDVVGYPENQQMVWSADPQNEDEQVPAVTSSTGSWLRPGEAYIEADFSYRGRIGPHKGMTLAFDRGASNILINPIEPNQILRINPGQGFSPGTRLTYGRILEGRDSKNRDESIEFTFDGLYRWDNAGSRTSRNANDLLSIWEPVRTVPGSANANNSVLAGSGFGLSNTQFFSYDSNLNSYEFTYRLQRRLGRDRIVLARDGSWVRTASPTFLPTFLMGPRVLTTRERFSYTASSINVNNTSTEINAQSAANQSQYATLNSGRYFIQTHNYLVGYQIGLDVDYQHPEWRIGAAVKGGPYINFADQSSQAHIVAPLDATTPSTIDLNNHSSENIAAFVGEINLRGVYYIRPTFAIRAGYDIMWLNSVAQAPSQLTFFPSNPAALRTGGNLFLQGGIVGFEWIR